jgi:hypothetical protein
MGDTGLHLVKAERLQVIRHLGGGTEFAVAELGVLMNVTTPLDDFGFNRGESIVESMIGLLTLNDDREE